MLVPFLSCFRRYLLLFSFFLGCSCVQMSAKVLITLEVPSAIHFQCRGKMKTELVILRLWSSSSKDGAAAGICAAKALVFFLRTASSPRNPPHLQPPHSPPPTPTAAMLRLPSSSVRAIARTAVPRAHFVQQQRVGSEVPRCWCVLSSIWHELRMLTAQ